MKGKFETSLALLAVTTYDDTRYEEHVPRGLLVAYHT